jgi:dipeptidyl aminopeptidase/acylaminoacyl peptidase
MHTVSGGVVLFCLLQMGGPLVAQEHLSVPDRTSAARSIISSLAAGNFAAVVERFDSTMQRVLPEPKLAETWDALVGQVGAFASQSQATPDRVQGFDQVTVATTFARATLDVRIVFNHTGQISGLWFAPHTLPPSSLPPPYADVASFQESDVGVGDGATALPGTLTLPTAAGRHPAVVLVHGSGPHDRDETIGPNRPFRDLAWGLASRGIAVLRYDKRTKVHAALIAGNPSGFTLREETIDEVLAAVALLRTTAGIDASRLFILGHSLGGMLAPRIAARDPGIAGVVILAGSTRPLHDILIAQHEYLARLDGSVTPDEEKRLADLRRDLAAVSALSAADQTSPRLILGAPPSYWLDLRAYDPVATARRLTRPMLILQGGRDYQVTMEDFHGWEAALSDRADVRIQVFPSLNHLFVAGEGTPTPAEYQSPGHVAPEVIEEITAWIRP